jgi:hypothetical protein
MAVLLMILLFAIFISIEYVKRPAKISSNKTVDHAWEGYKWSGAFAQDGGTPYENPKERNLKGLFGEGI